MAFVTTTVSRLALRAPLPAVCATRSRFVARPPSAPIRHPIHRPLTTMSTPAEGSAAPDFTATDTDGNTVSLAGFRNSNVVLFFMAGAGMGCTTQSCAFRDAAAEFNQLDAKIVAVSARTDGAAFKSNNSLTYPVINDGDGALQTLYGVPKTFGLIPGRITFVIDKEGIVRKVFNSQFSIAQHVKTAKDTVKALA